MNPPYVCVLSAVAMKNLDGIAESDLAKIEKALDELCQQPRGGQVKNLKGGKGEFHKRRVGKFRIVFTIIDEEKQIQFHDIGDRKDVYRP